MKIIVTNKRHPMELQVVANMLKGQGLKPQKLTAYSIGCEVPNAKWWRAIKEAVEFATGCGVELAEKK